MSLIILNFHGVGPVPRTIDSGEYGCWLDQNFFEAVLDLVVDRPNVRITVDDGNESDFTFILPALRRRNLIATFFVCSGRLDQPTFLSQQQVLGLCESGMSIGSHGVDHVSWRKLPPAELSHELQTSRSTLNQILGVPITSAACPFGDYSRTVLKHAREAGYHSFFTSDGGAVQASSWIQPRNTITRSTALTDIDRLVRNGPPLWTNALKRIRSLAKQSRL